MDELNPYLFRVNAEDNFETAVNKIKNAYFWAQVLEVGSAVQHGSVNTADGFEYYIVDLAPEGSENIMFTPEEFIKLLAGHYYQSKYYGYSRTIWEMANDWWAILKEAYPNQKQLQVDQHAIRIDHKGQAISVVSKEEAWRHIDILPF